MQGHGKRTWSTTGPSPTEADGQTAFRRWSFRTYPQRASVFTIFPRLLPPRSKTTIKKLSTRECFIYFLLESTCSSGPRLVHSNVPAAGFRDKQTEKGTPVFFVADLAFPSRIAHGRDEPRDAGRAPPNARAEYGRHCNESVATAPVAQLDPHVPPYPSNL